MYEIGDIVNYVPGCNQEKASGFGAELLKPRKGVVVYINREHRFYRAAFEIGDMTLYECYKF